MGSSTDILEIPLTKTKDVNELVKWFEKKKVYERDHPTLTLSERENFPEIVLIGIVLVVCMALITLEEKGKLKVKPTANKTKPTDFLDLLRNSKTETTIENHIKDRYNLELMFQIPHHGQIVSEPAEVYTLNDVFGMWEGKKNNLDKVREEQWGKRK